MLTYAKTARVVGALFIVASAAAIIGGSLLLPIEDSNYLTDVASADGRIVAGALLEVVLALAVIGIAVMLFPVLRRQNEGLALGYVGVRIVEGVLILAATLSALLVLSLSEDYGHSAQVGLEPLGGVLLAAREWTYLIGTMLVFGASALILYTLLYRSRLVPAWLSVWGLVGGLLLLVRAVLEMFGLDLAGALQAVLTAPIGLNEMVLAVWLIVRGFDASAPASTPVDPTWGGATSNQVPISDLT